MPSSKQEGAGAKSPTIPRGFACVDPERQRETPSQDGRAVHEEGATRAFDVETRGAARKGGGATGQRKVQVGRHG